MRILFATSEAIPYHKSGGLADVSRSLPDALAERGHDVWIVHPLYRGLRERGLELEAQGRAALPWPGGDVEVRYHLHRPDRGAPALLVEQPEFFDVAAPYEPLPGDDLAHARRFGLFCRAIVERARALEVDVVHLNDWQTGLVPAYGLVDGLPAATVFAIHNLAYQGNFPPRAMRALGLPRELLRTENGIEFFGQLSFMKGAIALADRIVTVSPTYAREIQTPEYGAGLDGLLRFRRRVLHGILNGIDPSYWDPASDPRIPATFTPRRLHDRDRNRQALVEELALRDDGPVFVMVTRLAHQKGIELLLDALPVLTDGGVTLAVLGDGEARYVRRLRAASAKAPDRVAVRFGFDDRLARLLYAGGDFFLMPSLYEPCGLGQLIAQRYGAPPIVRRTGGLADTVEEGKTGFCFDDATPDALLEAAARAVALWRTPALDRMRRRCMRLDRSWDRSAAAYEAVYQAARGALDEAPAAVQNRSDALKTA